ncbi:hypothetical protein, partial [Streptococcus pneumoniae]|uniref:hypothetical protein n=1 Tax=Streptococcus pneumoniae TaxID=1313 RepID=UPI0018B0B5AF
YKDPTEVMRAVSMGGYDQFIQSVFKQHAYIIFQSKDWANKVRRGILHAQDIAYSRKWGSINLDIFNKEAMEFE